MVTHLGTGVALDTSTQCGAVGPAGTGKMHLAIGLGIKAALVRYRRLRRRSIGWARLRDAHSAGQLPADSVKLQRIGLIIIDIIDFFGVPRLHFVGRR